MRIAGRTAAVSVFVGVLAFGLLAFAAPSLAQAESIEVSHGANPTQDIALSISVSGVADGHHKLYVIVNPYGTTCASTPYGASGTALAYGTSLGAGSYSKEYSYTPTQTGTYTICAYLDETEFSTPDATAASSFTAALPAASVSLEVSGSPTQDVSLTIKVSGSTQVSRALYVIVNPYGTTCASTPYGASGTALAYGTPVGAGTFSKEYPYTPTQIGSYTVCGYIDENEFATPNATGSVSFTSARPAASISFAISPGSTENSPVAIKASGSTQVSSALYVIVNPYGTTCASTPYGASGTALAYGTSLGAGSYSKEYSHTPNQTGRYTVCGYIDENEFATPNATGTGSFTNVTPQTRAEEAKRAAEQAAEHVSAEAAQAAEAKKLAEYLQGVAERGHCAELSSQYSASVGACQAKEAAIKAAREAREAAEEAEWYALREVDLAKPVARLVVKVMTHSGTRSQNPGHTTLRITTSPFAHVTIKWHRYGHRTERYDAWPASRTSRTGVLTPEYRWTCSRPGGTYSYVITAKTKVGRTLTRRGHFNPVSAGRCHALKRYEQEARERSARRYAEGVRREREAEEAVQREGEENCRARHGTVVKVYVEGEPRLGCIGAGGQELPWIR